MGKHLWVVVRGLFSLPLAPLFWMVRKVTMPRARWIHVRLRSRVVEVERPLAPLARFVPSLAAQRPTSLEHLRALVSQVVADSNVEGVVLEIPTLHAGWAAANALRDQIARLRSVGKRVVAWLPEGGGNRELFVASAADRILTTPSASLSVMGVAASSRYLKGLLDRLRVKVEVHRRAEFKTAAEATVSESMSDAQREQLGALLDVVDRALVKALSARPGWNEAKVRTLFDDAIVGADSALASGLIDGVCYEDGLAKAVIGEGAKPKDLVRAPRYFRLGASALARGLAPYVAVIPVHGAITSGPSPTGPSATREAVVATLRTVSRDPRALGVVLHVDSPGGAAHASDLIHREVELLRDRKPVVACFGEVAASGGYYVAAPAHAIVAQPLTLTGSIGVVSARLVAHDLLESVGVKTEVLRRAPHADLATNPRPMDQDEHAILEREIDAFYRTFVGVVARGRKRLDSEIEPLARGRVWSGQDAHARGLVDRLGGLDVAIDEVRARLSWLPAPLRSRVGAQVIWPKAANDVPPIPAAAAAALGALASALDPSLLELASLALGGERALFYAMGLPRIE